MGHMQDCPAGSFINFLLKEADVSLVCICRLCKQTYSQVGWGMCLKAISLVLLTIPHPATDAPVCCSVHLHVVRLFCWCKPVVSSSATGSASVDTSDPACSPVPNRARLGRHRLSSAQGIYYSLHPLPHVLQWAQGPQQGGGGVQVRNFLQFSAIFRNFSANVFGLSTLCAYWCPCEQLLQNRVLQCFPAPPKRVNYASISW